MSRLRPIIGNIFICIKDTDFDFLTTTRIYGNTEYKVTSIDINHNEKTTHIFLTGKYTTIEHGKPNKHKELDWIRLTLEEFENNFISKTHYNLNILLENV